MIHRVTRRLYRGPQPTLRDLERLQEKVGLKSVVNLREESRDSAALCEQLGLLHHYLPVRDWHVPSLGQVEEFLHLLGDEDSYPSYVHCWGGVGRTGVFVSCYRIRRGMHWETAISMSDDETPHLQMNSMQRQFLRRYGEEALRAEDRTLQY